MDFKKYENIKEFNKENLDLLLEKEWFNNLLLGNCLEGETVDSQDWLFARITENSNTELIIFHRLPWNLLLYSPTNNMSEELYKFAAEKIYEIDPNLNGVNSEKEMANKFAKYYSDISNKVAKLHIPMRILVLEKLNNAKLIENAIFREVKPEDKNILLTYLKEFRKEALGEEIDDLELENTFQKYLKDGYFVLEVDGKIVSQAAVNRILQKGKSVGAVYTPKEFRGKGYAYNLVYQLSKKCLDDGSEFCVLYTDDTNPISNHVYEKIGYKRMSDWNDIKFE